MFFLPFHPALVRDRFKLESTDAPHQVSEKCFISVQFFIREMQIAENCLMRCVGDRSKCSLQNLSRMETRSSHWKNDEHFASGKYENIHFSLLFVHVFVVLIFKTENQTSTKNSILFLLNVYHRTRISWFMGHKSFPSFLSIFSHEEFLSQSDLRGRSCWCWKMSRGKTKISPNSQLGKLQTIFLGFSQFSS